MITLLRRRTRSVRRARKTRILASVKSSRMLPFFHYLAGFVQIGANLTSTVSMDQERCWASSWRETGSNQGGAACLTLPSRKLRLRRPPGERWVKDMMRVWIDEPGGKLKGPSSREYETVGYVISGSAKLDIEGQTLNLKRGDSWLVPAGAMHQYTIIEPFTAVEATAPPAEVHGRDTPE